MIDNHIDKGKKGEKIALDFLLKKGFLFKKKNWRYKHLEVDLILQRNEIIHFIEVKTRKSDHFVTPLQSITKKKIKNLISAADQFLKDSFLEASFDLVLITLSPFKIEHIENAFNVVNLI